MHPIRQYSRPTRSKPRPSPKAGLNLSYAPPRYRSTFFSHIWGGGYAAGYYAYQWAETLENQAIAWFEANGGLTRANGDRLRHMVLSRGNTEELAPMFAAFLAPPTPSGKTVATYTQVVL